MTSLQICVWYSDRWWLCRHRRIWRVFRRLGSEEGHQLQQDRTQQVSGWSQCCSLWSRLWEVWEWWGSHCEFYIEYQRMWMFIIMQVLLVTGGQQWSGNSSIPLDSTEILETNTWRISAPLPSARYGLRAASLGNTIFLFGEKMFRMNLYFNSNLFRRTWWIIWTKHHPEIQCHQPDLGEDGGDGGEEIWPYCYLCGGCLQA